MNLRIDKAVPKDRHSYLFKGCIYYSEYIVTDHYQNLLLVLVTNKLELSPKRLSRLTEVGFVVTFSRYPDRRLMKGSWTDEINN